MIEVIYGLDQRRMGLSFKRNARGLLVSRRENQINDPTCMGEKRAEFGLNVRRKNIVSEFHCMDTSSINFIC